MTVQRGALLRALYVVAAYAVAPAGVAAAQTVENCDKALIQDHTRLVSKDYVQIHVAMQLTDEEWNHARKGLSAEAPIYGVPAGLDYKSYQAAARKRAESFQYNFEGSNSRDFMRTELSKVAADAYTECLRSTFGGLAVRLSKISGETIFVDVSLRTADDDETKRKMRYEVEGATIIENDEEWLKREHVGPIRNRPIRLKHIPNEPVSFGLEVGRLPKAVVHVPLLPRIFTKEKGKEVQVRRETELKATGLSRSRDAEWCVYPSTDNHRFVTGRTIVPQIAVREAYGEEAKPVPGKQGETEICFHLSFKSSDGSVGSIKVAVEPFEYELRTVPVDLDKNWLPSK